MGYEPLAYRYLTFTSHYGNKLNFTWDGIEASQVSLNRLRENYKEHMNGSEKIGEDSISELKERFKAAINDDLNFPAALAVVWEVAKSPIKSKDYAMLLKHFDTVLSLNIDAEPFKKEEKLEVSKEIEALLEQRKQARTNKDFALSDEIRDKLASIGYKVIDTKEGQKLELL